LDAESEPPRLADLDRRRGFQVGFAVDGIRQAHELLRQKGATPITEIIEGGESLWAYVVDPDRCGKKSSSAMAVN
jgi:hypothetical protein